MRAFKGVWIPREIWLSKALTLTEKALLVEIDSLDMGDDHCYASNSYLADFLDCSVATVTRGIKKLATMGLIKVDVTKSEIGTDRVIKSLIDRPVIVEKTPAAPASNCLGGASQNDEGGTSKRRGGASQNDEHNNTKSNNTIIGDQEHCAEPQKFDFKKTLLDLGVDPQHLADWLVVRKKGKGVNTITALETFLDEVALSGLTVAQAVHFCAGKPWVGFRADWYENQKPKTKPADQHDFSRFRSEGARDVTPQQGVIKHDQH